MINTKNTPLSNMYPCEFWMNGYRFTSSEMAFQFFKCNNEADRLFIIDSKDGYQAKQRGRKVSMVKDWLEIRESVMYDVIQEKLLQNPLIMIYLMDTEDNKINELNHWHDHFWGICSCNSCPEGQNKLGSILMTLRNEYNKE